MRDFRRIQSCATDTVLGDLCEILRRLAARGLPEVVAIDLSTDELPVRVARVIVPGLEGFAPEVSALGVGALRAAERDAFGLKGVGQIYRWYASGRLEDDDEVAIVHGPADQGYRDLSEAMVNVRDAGHQVNDEDTRAVEEALRRELGLLSADDTAQ